MGKWCQTVDRWGMDAGGKGMGVGCQEVDGLNEGCQGGRIGGVEMAGVGCWGRDARGGCVRGGVSGINLLIFPGKNSWHLRKRQRPRH